MGIGFWRDLRPHSNGCNTHHRLLCLRYRSRTPEQDMTQGREISLLTEFSELQPSSAPPSFCVTWAGPFVPAHCPLVDRAQAPDPHPSPQSGQGQRSAKRGKGGTQDYGCFRSIAVDTQTPIPSPVLQEQTLKMFRERSSGNLVGPACDPPGWY